MGHGVEDAAVVGAVAIQRVRSRVPASRATAAEGAEVVRAPAQVVLRHGTAAPFGGKLQGIGLLGW